MDRPSGLAVVTATQPPSRPLVESGMSYPPPLNTVRRIPNPTVRHESSTSSSLSAPTAMFTGQVVALAREAMKTALAENQTKAAEASGVSNELRPGVTIDLSHKQIQRFPEEVVDIIKTELERLALSHNQISTFPSRFSECTSLRYLNVRNNVIREFPQCICELTSLEILDLGRNKLKVLPPELAKLTSLKVLSVQKNRIEELPLCLADMVSLQVLKLDGNPLPKEILQPRLTTPPNGGFQEKEIHDIAITTHIKKYLKEKAISDRSETESGGEESSEGTETPRPIKRVMSGRFPIKVNGSDIPDLRSPALPRAPPIPSRSHYRGLSQQNAALRRPGVMPLTIGSANERLRSNSEGLVPAARPSDRSRRMGIVSRKASELGTVDESKANRYSHYRGLSHGSAMQNGSNGSNGTANSNSPASPADSAAQRATYVRRLSSLPERKRESTSPDPVIEGAKGILYALFQVHPLIQNLLGLARDGTNKRTSLERVFYNTTTHVEELDRHIQNYITYSEEDEEISPRSNENVHSACLTSVQAYIHVLGLLSRNVETLLDNGDPRYIRTLLLLIYGSAAEVRNAGADLFRHGRGGGPSIPEVIDETLRFPARDKSTTPTRERLGLSLRNRSVTAVQNSGNLRVATDAPPPASFQPSLGRSATMTSATPRSGDSFTSSNTSSDRMMRGDFSDEDRLFEKIFLRLQQSSEMAIRTLPSVNNHFIKAMKLSSQQNNSDLPKQFWQFLIQKCTLAHQAAENLKARLSLIKLKEPGIRTQSAFWELCSAFVQTYTDLVVRVKEAKSATSLLPTDVIVILRPLQKAIKDTSQVIQNSPWSFLAGPQSSNGMSTGISYGLQSPASQVPLPMTPQSAALGPAVQATVPSTPQSSSYNAMFSGGVFERADAYLAMSASNSVASSRTGTMTSTLGSNDGMMTPATMLSPMNSMSSRFNSNGKVTF